MKVGKLSTDHLHKLIDGNTGARRQEVVIRPKVGEDCAVLRFGDEGCILSTDPITGSSSEVGKLAVHINGNDIASSGGEIIGLMLTILAPEGTSFEALEAIMKQASDEAKKLNIEIIGGHTEITKAVNQIVVSATAVGKESLDKIVATGGGHVGDRIIITKGIGIEGTGIIAFEKAEALHGVLTPQELQEAQAMLELVSVYKEGRIAGNFGVTSMHDVTEGGIFGALWEGCTASEIGCTVDINRLPVAPVTRKICMHFDINPYQLISSGSMIITVAAEKSEDLIDLLKTSGIQAFDIGEMTEAGIAYCDEKGQIHPIPEPDSDELYKVI
jgi:hydrogenase expression/formation protein HypE